MGRTRVRSGGRKDITGQDADLKQAAFTDRTLAYERLFCRYQQRLFWHALGIVKDPQAAEDMVQKVFIKAFAEKRLFIESFRIRAWLYRVTSNWCFNYNRDRKRRKEILALNGDMLRPDGEDLQRRVYTQQVGGVMGNLMKQLTADHRQILTLRYWAD
ncbi:MAG: RNA polymerase sigma factor, partial [bacterium]|nr:RNA polymerase sigma factor [bacterium]